MYAGTFDLVPIYDAAFGSVCEVLVFTDWLRSKEFAAIPAVFAGASGGGEQVGIGRRGAA